MEKNRWSSTRNLKERILIVLWSLKVTLFYDSCFIVLHILKTYLEADGQEFEAYIDPENKFEIQDKFSQINVLEQIKNLNTYKCLDEKLKNGYLQSHALWVNLIWCLIQTVDLILLFSY